MSTYLVSMAISLNIDEKNPSLEKKSIRKSQYIRGIEKLKEYMPLFQKHNVDFHISDNTCETLDNEIAASLPANTIVTCFKNNHFGSQNKGAGLMEVWNHNRDLYNHYEYILHFEPRTLLNSDKFFQSFFEHPRNLFTPGIKAQPKQQHFYTGLFACQSKDLIMYCEMIHPDFLCKNSISIEEIFAEFINKYSNYDTIDYADVSWWYAGHTDPILF